MKTLAIITARGGSKGIHKKNIVSLRKKPLIYYTLKAAKESRFLDKIIVSTDDNKIARVAIDEGVSVPFKRPKNISHDTASSKEVIKHALKFLEKNENYIPDIIVILQPTSPLRSPNLIDRSIQLLQKSKASSVISVKKVKSHPFLNFRCKGSLLEPLKKDFEKYYQRQKFSNLYYPTGAIYTFWYDTLKKYDSYYGPRIKPIITSDEDSIDVDSLFDLFICEMTMKHWNNYKEFF